MGCRRCWSSCWSKSRSAFGIWWLKGLGSWVRGLKIIDWRPRQVQYTPNMACMLFSFDFVIWSYVDVFDLLGFPSLSSFFWFRPFDAWKPQLGDQWPIYWCIDDGWWCMMWRRRFLDDLDKNGWKLEWIGRGFDRGVFGSIALSSIVRPFTVHRITTRSAMSAF